MKVIFLDFDGVLNCIASFARDKCPDSIWEPCVQELDRIVRETGAKVVVSSTWRKLFPLEHLTCLLRANGFSGEVLDKTPALYRGFSELRRGQEISAWLAGHPDVESFVILDDNADMDELMPYLVQTSMDSGLTREHADIAIEVLTG